MVLWIGVESMKVSEADMSFLSLMRRRERMLETNSMKVLFIFLSPAVITL